MIRRALIRIFIVALCGSLNAPASGAPATIGEWLYANTGLSQQNFSASKMSKPDYLAGKTKDQMCSVIGRFGTASANAGTWIVLAYDRAHHLGLAASSTDACNVTLFSAPPPPKAVRNADLSAYQTVRGIRIGTSYGKVISTYGGKAKRGSHFLAAFSAPVPGERSYDGKRFVKLSEDIVVKVDDSRVSAISILIDLGDLT
jgi:hypothetical protein